MAENDVNIQPTKINHIEIKGGIAFSAEHSRIWAEGTDEEVEKLGGEHSAKGWAGSAFEGNKEYTDEQVDAAKTELYGAINTQSVNVLNQAKSYTDTSISQEVSLRQAADNNLQTQIDAITSASDVFDIVGTYQDLLEYDTSTVPVNDIIKVLEDESRDDASTYYRWDGTEWVFVGSEGPTYTKAEADAKFLTQSDAASTYATQSSLTSGLATKQNTLTTGTGVSIVGNTISGVVMSGASSSSSGTAGMVPTPTSSDAGKFLKGDGTWGSVEALPSQTGQSGKFLTTDGTNASWGTPPQGLKNTATGTDSLTLLGTATASTNAINIGTGSQTSARRGLALGYRALASGQDAVAIGSGSESSTSTRTTASGEGSVAIGQFTVASGERGTALGWGASASAYGATSVGQFAYASAQYAIQIGQGFNSTANTLSVGLDGSHNYQLLNSSGKIPMARLPSMSPTLTWYTGNTGTTVTIANTSSAALVKVYKNGVLLQPTQDYSISGTTLTLVTPIVSTDKITTEVF